MAPDRTASFLLEFAAGGRQVLFLTCHLHLAQLFATHVERLDARGAFDAVVLLLPEGLAACAAGCVRDAITRASKSFFKTTPSEAVKANYGKKYRVITAYSRSF